MQIKKIMAGFISAVMVLTAGIIPSEIFSDAILNTGITADAETTTFPSEKTECCITNQQFISGIVRVFNLSCKADEETSLFTDIMPDYEYYNDFVSAVNSGLLDMSDESALPDKNITREYAAHIVNKLLGFVNSKSDYSFIDYDLFEFKDDAEIAVERGWFKTIDNKFMPNKNVTESELNKILSDAETVLKGDEIDPHHVNNCVFADYVVEVPQNMPVEMNGDNTVTIKDSGIKILPGDTFAVFYNEIPYVFIAKTVQKFDNIIVITTDEADISDAVEYMDFQQSTSMNLSDFSPASGFTVLAKDDSINLVNKKVEICEGATGSFNISISNLKLNQTKDSSKSEVYVSGNIKCKGTVQADVSKLTGYRNKITLGYFPISGVGNIILYMNASLEGEIDLEWEGSFKVGASMDSGGGLRLIDEFKKDPETTVTVKASAQIGLTVALTIDLLVMKGELSVSAGINAGFITTKYGDGNTPKQCTTLSAYLYANAGVKVECIAFSKDKQFNRSIPIFTAENSPLKFCYHNEDGTEVSECTRGKDFKNESVWENHYYHEPIGVGTTSYGGGIANAEPYSIFEYETVGDSSKSIMIIGYYGNITTVDIPETIDGFNVIQIGKEAFANDSVIKNVNIADTITRIDESAFENCSSLKKVKLSNSLTSIGVRAFADCTALNSINIPKSLKNIDVKLDAGYPLLHGYLNVGSVPFVGNIGGCGIFAGCSTLENIEFEDGIREIPRLLFSFCNGLKNITLPDSIVKINEGAFGFCNNLQKVTMSNSVTEIPLTAFYYCASLNDINIPSSIKEIGIDAFSYSGVTKLVIPNSVEKIGGAAFRDCSKLESVQLSKNLKTLDPYAFGNCDKLSSIKIPKGVVNSGENYTFYNGWTTTYKKYGVFADSDNLKSAVIEDGATVIVHDLFRECGLEEIDMPDTVTIIEERALGKCEKLKSIKLSSTLDYIKDQAFFGCSSLDSVNIPDSVTSMGKDTFGKCTSLKTAKLPNQRVNIVTGTFAGCTNLETVEVPDTVEAIRESAFENCSSLKTLKIPNGLQIIEKEAFKNSGLEVIKLTDSKAVTEIGNEAFYGCKNLSEIEIPKTVTIIGEGAFNTCENLSSVKLGNKLETISSDAFRNCYELTSIDIPKSVTGIGNKAFGENIKLEKASIYNPEAKIASDAFSYPNKMTIYGYNGSTAEAYANDYDFKFESLGDQPQSIPGDVNDDGTINLRDAVIIRRFIAGGWDLEINEKTADVDGDGKITLRDATLIRRYIAGGWDVEL